MRTLAPLAASLFFFIAGVVTLIHPQENRVANGNQLFDAICRRCHVPDSPVFPGLQVLFKRDTLPFSKRPTNEENVRNQILFGSTSMPPAQISNEELEDLIAYLKTL